MPSVVIRPKALEDLAGIWVYIAEDSPRQADAFAAAIDREIRDLARHPLIGRARPELLSDLRSLPFGRYLIFYLPRKRNRGRACSPRRTRLEALVRRRHLSLFVSTAESPLAEIAPLVPVGSGPAPSHKTPEPEPSCPAFATLDNRSQTMPNYRAIPSSNGFAFPAQA